MFTTFRCTGIPTIASGFRLRSSEGSFPVAEDAYERLISLPMFHSMTAQDVEDVVFALRKVTAHYQERAEHPELLGARRSQ